MEPNLDQIRRAWTQATDSDVTTALGCADDYAPEVFNIIRNEAVCRGIDGPVSIPARSKPAAHLRQAAARLTGLIQRHWLLSAAALGCTLRIAGRLLSDLLGSTGITVHDLAWFGGYWAVFLGGLIVLSRPLTSIRRAVLVTTAATVATSVVSVIEVWVDVRPPPPVPIHPTLAAFIALAGFWALSFGVLASIVGVRRRWWPVHRPGHCKNCGYNLTGLPEPRCPECGTPFERD